MGNAYSIMKAVLTLFLLLTAVHACLWDSDTIRDELKADPSVYDLITGQFPHHGDLYYEKRKEKLEGKPEKTHQDQIDLGVAYTRLKEFGKAESLFLSLLEKNPKEYEILSNLGVLYKKKEDYQKAHDYIKKALEIKPEGHMGLGDWYLKRISYSLNREGKENLNFLGEPYITEQGMRVGAKQTLSVKEQKRRMQLLRLIHNDRHFPDTYFVLGDVLMRKGDLNLARRAFMKAQKLGHPRADVINKRLEVIEKHVKEALSHDGKRVRGLLKKQKLESRESINQELKKGEAWINVFIEAENALVQKGYFPSFIQTEKTLNKKKHYPK